MKQKGIQKIRINHTGKYFIRAWGAGNRTCSGNEFTIFVFFFKKRLLETETFENFE